jgi:hypothetical protein
MAWCHMSHSMVSVATDLAIFVCVGAHTDIHEYVWKNMIHFNIATDK